MFFTDKIMSIRFLLTYPVYIHVTCIALLRYVQPEKVTTSPYVTKHSIMTPT